MIQAPPIRQDAALVSSEVEDFRRLQAKFARVFKKVFTDPLAPRSVLILPSLTLDQEVLAKALSELSEEAEIGVYQLAEGSSSTLTRVTLKQQLADREMTGPILLASPIG